MRTTDRCLVCVAAFALAAVLPGPAGAQHPAGAASRGSIGRFDASPLRLRGSGDADAKKPNPVIGGGTDGQVAVWTAANTIGDSIITARRGKVGIGTLDLTSTLTVGGTIESTSGGFKFPDGTLQGSAGLALVSHDFSLTGAGTKAAPLGIADGGVTSAKIAPAQVVKSFNGLFDDVTLAAGANITITPSGNMLTIAASDGDGISRVIHDTTLDGAGTAAMPLGIHVPLALNMSGAGAVISATNGNATGIQGSGNIGVLGIEGDVDVEGIGGSGVVGVSEGGSGVLGVGAVFGIEGRARDGGDAGAGVSGGGGSASAFDHAGAGVRGEGGAGGTGGGGSIDTSGGTGVIGHGGTHPELGGDGVVGIGGDADNTGTTTGGNGVVGIGGDGAFSQSSHGLGGVGVMGFDGAGSDNNIVGANAGYFAGDVEVTGVLTQGTGGSKIDHPLDPENKTLSHSFVESPDMMNIYDGVVMLDADGEATIELPEWFSALNRDFRYQLTAVGAPAPGLYVATEVTDNRFGIAGGVPGMKVSWQLTGTRQDAFAKAHRIQVEQDKPERERGTYLYPSALGQPAEKSVEWARHPEIMKRIEKVRAKSAPR